LDEELEDVPELPPASSHQSAPAAGASSGAGGLSGSSAAQPQQNQFQQPAYQQQQQQNQPPQYGFGSAGQGGPSGPGQGYGQDHGMGGDGNDRLRAGDAPDEGLVNIPYSSLPVVSLMRRLWEWAQVEEVAKQRSLSEPRTFIQHSYVPRTRISSTSFDRLCGRHRYELYTDQDVPFFYDPSQLHTLHI
jgi:hypothetical protein